MIRALPTILIFPVLLLCADSVAAEAGKDIERLAAMRQSDPVALMEILDREISGLSPEVDARYAAHLFRLRGQTLRDRGEYGRAEADAVKFELRARALNDPLLVSRALMLKGTIDAEQNHLADALDRFHEARRLLEGTDHATELSMINTAIGVTHNFALDFVRARKYYEEALRLARVAGDTALESSALGNLALAVSELEGPAAGLPMHQQALALAEEYGDRHGVALQNGLICERLLQLGRLPEARATCLKALDLINELQLSRPRAGMRMTLGDISLAEGKSREAVSHYELAMDDAREVVPGVVRTLHQKLFEAYDTLGEPGTALGHLKALEAIREETRDREREAALEELDVKYQVEQSERKLEVMTLDARLQDAQLRQRTQLLLAAGIALVLASLGALIAWRGFRVKARLQRELDARNRALERAVDQIGQLARTDALTGLLNRRAIEEMAAAEMARAKRTGLPLTVALADIDRFKTLNDRFGHQAGDEVLKSISGHFRNTLRSTDLLCRWGGEEFLCLLPDNDTAAALLAMERLRGCLATHPLEVDGETVPITMTFGIAPLTDDLDAAIRDADAAMYEGKRSGRNQIVVAEQPA